MDEDLSALGVAWDAWRTTRGGAAGIVARQTQRLDALVRRARLNIRLTVGENEARAEVWPRVQARLRELLARQGVSRRVAVDLDDSRPAVNPRSGKLRHVLRVSP